MRSLVVAVALVCAGVAGLRQPGPRLPFFHEARRRRRGSRRRPLLAFIEEAEQKIDALHSVMIVRHGQVVAEGWWAPYAATEPHSCIR